MWKSPSRRSGTEIGIRELGFFFYSFPGSVQTIPVNTNDLIQADFDELSDSDLFVLIACSTGTPISKVRLQKLALLYTRITGEHPEWFADND